MVDALLTNVTLAIGQWPTIACMFASRGLHKRTCESARLAWAMMELITCQCASIVKSGKPMLGICFGGQLIARAMGGSVSKAPQCEIGWKSIWSDDTTLVSDGPWFQFHYDRWQLPPGALEIARNPIASQSFVIQNSLAVQFHPEITADSLKSWMNWGGHKSVIENGQDPEIMLAQTLALKNVARERTFDLVDAFLKRVAKF
jgi:GMP synthase-like glutamine amidotransferase